MASDPAAARTLEELRDQLQLCMLLTLDASLRDDREAARQFATTTADILREIAAAKAKQP